MFDAVAVDQSDQNRPFARWKNYPNFCLEPNLKEIKIFKKLFLHVSCTGLVPLMNEGLRGAQIEQKIFFVNLLVLSTPLSLIHI